MTPPQKGLTSESDLDSGDKGGQTAENETLYKRSIRPTAAPLVQAGSLPAGGAWAPLTGTVLAAGQRGQKMEADVFALNTLTIFDE